MSMGRRVDMEFAFDRPAPSRSANCTVCISFTASVVISTFACTMVVLHLFGIQPTVSPTKEPTVDQYHGKLTQNIESKPRSKPHAHLVADSGSKNNNGILDWKNISKDDLNMEYNVSERSLVIPENGFYIIYLTISYRALDKFNCKKGDPVFLQHSITQMSERYNTRQIINSFETVTCGDQWLKTTHNMARILLHKDDRLQVKVSHYDLVDIYGQYRTKTFWGVYLDLN
ncbi:tumor necrosis factor-like [Sardina pilchardus]|uniref:tumor necrosis factor-like n=1 Tax=Sardina pilchardus TaxID=27697 RepID=UPI002E0FDAEF